MEELKAMREELDELRADVEDTRRAFESLIVQVNDNTAALKAFRDELLEVRQKAEVDIAKNAAAFHEILSHAKEVAQVFAQSTAEMTEKTVKKEIERGYEELKKVAQEAEAILNEKALEACKKTELKIARAMKNMGESGSGWQSFFYAFAGVGSAGGILALYYFFKAIM